MKHAALALCLLGGMWATAHADAACTVPDHLPPARLSGVWTLSLWPEDAPRDPAPAPVSQGTVSFERHPEFEASVRGRLQRNAAGQSLQALLSGDVTDGEFHLDESADGRAMSGVWSGVAQDCGGRVTINGMRRPAEGAPGDAAVLRFRLDKAPGWR